MGKMIRVLIVDDSELVQAVLQSILGSDPELEVVGAAANGHQAVDLTRTLRPDVIVMDINMPELGGLGATERIMAYHPTPILVLTSMDRADVAFEALSRGALDVIEKPELDDEKCRELLRRIKLSAGVRVVTHIAGRRTPMELPESVDPGPPASGPSRPATLAPPRAAGLPRPGRVVGIGSSTGGPQVLGQICQALPADFPGAILVVQHIAEGFVPVLTDWLHGSSRIRVKEAEDGEALEGGVAYIAPSNLHLQVTGNRIALEDGPPMGGHRPSVDALLSSIARKCGKEGMGIILSGMGRDGARGLREIRQAGGFTMAQAEETCVVYGMPKAAVELDGVSRVLDPQGIAGEMQRRVQQGERR